MKRTILITGAALSLVLGAVAIAQTTNETVTNPGTTTMKRAEDPANNAGLPGGVLPQTSTTPVPSGSTAATTSDQSMSPGATTTTSSTSAGTYGSNASATTSSDSSMSSSSGSGMSGGASMAGERG